MKTTSATNASATAKWAVTHHGFKSVWTTTPPNAAWPITSGTADDRRPDDAPDAPMLTPGYDRRRDDQDGDRRTP